jgi:hypothetical protein
MTMVESLPREEGVVVILVKLAALVVLVVTRAVKEDVGDKDREDFLSDLGGIPLRLFRSPFSSPSSSSTVVVEYFNVLGVIIFFFREEPPPPPPPTRRGVFFLEDNFITSCLT